MMLSCQGEYIITMPINGAYSALLHALYFTTALYTCLLFFCLEHHRTVICQLFALFMFLYLLFYTIFVVSQHIQHLSKAFKLFLIRIYEVKFVFRDADVS